MQLLTLADADTLRSTLVFRYSRARALLGTGTAAVAAVALAIVGRAGAFPPGRWIAAGIAVLLVIMRRFVLARFRPTNWLVRTCDSGVLLQLRSYLNYHFPPADRTVVLIPYGAISSARLVREHATVRDAANPRRTTTRTQRFVELTVAEDTAPLSATVADERAQPPPAEPHWYGSSSTRYDHHPVCVPAPGVVRIEWSVVPGPARLLDALRPYATITAPAATTEDFTTPNDLPPSERDARVRALVERGETVAAVSLVRQSYGYGLAQARRYVEDLRGEPSTRADDSGSDAGTSRTRAR